MAPPAYGEGTVSATVHNVRAGDIYRLDGRSLTLTRAITTEPARALTTAGGQLWALFDDGGARPTARLTALDSTDDRQLAPPIALPAGNPDLVVAENKEVWVAPVDRDGNVEIAPS